MLTNVTMPATIKSETKPSIGRWFKRSGDPVTADEPLVEIDADNVMHEICAPVTGVLSRILVKDGESVEYHTVHCGLSDKLGLIDGKSTRTIGAILKDQFCNREDDKWWRLRHCRKEAELDE